MSTIPLILSQHAEEAAFKWLLRNRAVDQPHFRLKDLARLDSAVDAHLDGLRVAGEAGWECVREELAHDEPGEFFTAAWLSMALGKRAAFDEVIAKAAPLVAGEPDIETAIISAILWLDEPTALRVCDEFVAASDPWLRRLGIVATAEMRRLVPSQFSRLFEAPDRSLLPPILKAAGQSNRPELLPGFRNFQRDTDAEIRFRAAWAGAVSGDPSSVSQLREFIRADSPHATEAVELYFRRATPGDAAESQRFLSTNATTARLAIQAAGAAGLPESIAYLIDCMAVPAHARLAGEALSTITGMDLDGDDLTAEAPPDFEAGPSEDPGDDNVAMDADEDLPWPHPGKIREWLDERRNEFPPGQRLLLGKPLALHHVSEALVTARQRQRAAAALELALLQKGTPLFNVSAPAFRQQRLLI